MSEKRSFEAIDEKLFSPETTAAKVLTPLLDALNWKGDPAKMLEALTTDGRNMETEDLLETMANLNFQNHFVGNKKGSDIDTRLFPVLIVHENNHSLLLNAEGGQILVFDGKLGVFRQRSGNQIKGKVYCFKYAEASKESLVQPQEHWFRKLVYRFRKALGQLVLLTMLITLLDLTLPIFVVLIYDRIPKARTIEPVLLTFVGILIYLFASYGLSRVRMSVQNYISTRMGAIISQQTFTRLVYLSPSYTETASISSQISRIKDFEGLKRFVTSGNFVELIDLFFAVIYVVGIFWIGGWVGFVPLVTLGLLILLSILMRPFHRIRMESVSDFTAKRQQNLIEILRNADEIKASGEKKRWLKKTNQLSGESIMSSFALGKYVSLSNGISYFITNTAALVIIYGCVTQIFAGAMSMGALIGVLMLYWKAAGSIRGAFSLYVQVNGLMKSITQIDRFMKLPQDSSLKSSMTAAREIKGRVRFSDVSIRYGTETDPILLNVSFENTPGKILGISGHDGAGKSTVLKLILGMYKPQGGRIYIDNINIKQLEPLSLRRSIGYAPEKDLLLSGTIRDQFSSVRPDITDTEIRRLTEETGLNEYMKKYSYTLDSVFSNETLKEASPAFRKLLNLTRMLARDTKLYLVDEPSNYLNRDEMERIAALLKRRAEEQNAAVIIVTNEEAFLNYCDEVIRLNQGRVQRG